MLDPTGFGRLYTGWAVLNVLVAPISIIALLLSSYFAQANASKGPAFVSRMLARVAAIAVPWTAATVLLLEVAVLCRRQADRRRLAGADPGAAADRGIVSGRGNRPRFAAGHVAVCGLWRQLVLVVRRPMRRRRGWVAVDPVAVGMFCRHAGGKPAHARRPVLGGRRRRRRPGGAAADVTADSPKLASYSLRRALAFCSAFVGFVLFNNADIFLAYLILSPADLGIYTASSVLPKAIVTATQPVVQIILPVVISIQGEGEDTSQAVMKAIFAAFALGAAAFVVLWPGSDLGLRRAARHPVLHVAADAAVGRGGGAIVGHTDPGHGRCRAWPLLAAASTVPGDRGICRRDDADKGIGAGREPSSRHHVSLFLLGIACGLGGGGNFPRAVFRAQPDSARDTARPAIGRELSLASPASARTDRQCRRSRHPSEHQCRHCFGLPPRHPHVVHDADDDCLFRSDDPRPCPAAGAADRSSSVADAGQGRGAARRISRSGR